MELIQQVIAWVKAHWVEIVSIYTSIVGIASVIVRWTPTLRDDTILLSIVKFLGKYVALNTSGHDAARAGLSK